MPRLLLITSDFLPQIGGVSLMMHHLANALVGHGVETAVVAPMQDEGDIGLEHRYRVYPDPHGSFPMVSIHRRRREDRRITELLDSVVADFQPTVMLLGAWHAYDAAALTMRDRYGIPLAAYFHGYDLRGPLASRASPGLRLAARVLRTPTRRQRVLELVHRTDHLLANSRYTADLVAQAAPGRTARVTGCGLPREQWQREFELTPRHDPALKAQRRRDLGLDDRPMVAFVGRLVSSKNVETLLHAMARLPGAQCVVMGDGTQRAPLMALAGQLGLRERVTFTGSVAGEAKWAYLRAADVFCLPSKELPGGPVEGFGIVLLEAAAAGTPVVAARSGGMVDVVEHERSGLLIDPSDAEALAAALDRLMRDPVLAAACVERAREAIRDRFNWDRVAQTIMAHLTEG